MASMKLFFKIIGGALASWYLSLSPVVTALILLSSLDIFSGLVRAWNQKNLSSTVSRKGMTKKAMIFIIVGAAWILDKKLGIQAATSIELSAMVAGFYCVTEVISIIENATQIGLPVPKALVDKLHAANSAAEAPVEVKK